MSVLPLGILLLSGAAFAAGNETAGALGEPPAFETAAKAASAAPALLAEPAVLRGTLGDLKIQVNLRPKAGLDEGIEGEYFVFGHSQKILLAGELEGDSVLLEESENGTDVSGQWDGKRTGNIIEGTWTSADGSVSKPFIVKAIDAKASVAKAKPPRMRPSRPLPRAPQ